MVPRRLGSLLLVISLTSCGGGGGSPTGPTTMPSPSAPGFSVRGLVFLDENANGRLDGGETLRVPDVEVRLGGRSARSAVGTGQLVVEGVPAGSQLPTVAAETLPPYFVAGAVPALDVPQPDGAQVLVPLTLNVRGTRPGVYVAFGDSLTRGDGAPTTQSYPSRLQARLQAHFGSAEVVNRGADATNSYEAVERIKRNLSSNPAYTLILYGTNDWHDQTCQDRPPCQVAENLRQVIREVHAVGSLAFVSTILPVNPALNPGRNQWVNAVNESIRTMARSEGAFVVDANAFFTRRSDLTSLYSDEVHLNEAGYDVLSQAFFEAIAHGRSTPASVAR
jgi:lysophospholipase L1-like esterase